MSLRSIWLGKAAVRGVQLHGTRVAPAGRMVDRRRSQRLAFSEPQHARIRTVHEAVIARRDGHCVEVTTTEPAARGERLVLQFTTATGEVTADVTYVVSCTPHECDEGRQWRLLLSLIPVGDLEPQPAR